MCSGSTDQCELTEFFVVMLSVDISQCLLRSKHNIEHDVTNCPFLTKKYSKCDSLADFLSYLEHVMIEAVELLNKFEESKPETCFVFNCRVIDQNIILNSTYYELGARQTKGLLQSEKFKIR